MQRDQRAVVLASKHAFFARQVCEAFDVYASALPSQLRDGVQVVDFTDNLYVFNMCRTCLTYGARLEIRDDGIWIRKDSRAMILSSAHLVYAKDMAEKFDIYFSPLVPEMRGDVSVLDYSSPGRLQTYKSGLQFQMASFPEEEEAIEEYFKWYRPRNGDLVFDIGAHCGVSTYQLSRLVGQQGRVIAFEPDPVNCDLLRKNVERHGLTNVTVEASAVAGKGGIVRFNSESSIGSSLQSLLLRDSVGSTVLVNAVTLEQAFERWGVPTFCKVDIEGAEIDVFASSAKMLKEHPTQLAVDTNHPQANGRMTNGEVEAILQSCGYETLSEASPLLTTWARPRC